MLGAGRGVNKKGGKDPITLGGAVSYRITVQGIVPQNWSDRLGGMKLAVSQGDIAAADRSILEGELYDQSELHGVLDTLYHLHLPIIKVEQMYTGND